MKKYLILALLGNVLCNLSLHGQSITSDHDTHIDFKKFKTYAWLAPGDSVLNRYRRDKLFSGSITYAANAELKSRGMAMDTLKPDAVFLFFTSVEEITTYSQTPTLSLGLGVAGPGYYVAGSAPVAGGKIIEKTEADGVLKFAMYDTETRKQVWTGMVNKTFNPSDDVSELVMEYTAKIFKKYPLKKSR
ncbi:DUF4136 domain-containing protein [Chryseolinea sp. T2]|uniref:DUF4136 domain-containing protein n=1 Tax=Chryseolinea sp. T2 TaxID=3129255 RepID=UPI003077797C